MPNRSVRDDSNPVGRLAGSLYARQHDRFALVRESFDSWTRRNGSGAAFGMS